MNGLKKPKKLSAREMTAKVFALKVLNNHRVGIFASKRVMEILEKTRDSPSPCQDCANCESFARHCGCLSGKETSRCFYIVSKMYEFLTP